ncbi:tripartite motif-containing protein 30A-like [Mastomys coucha]|uniref:tripartite motif-containing protein 30A-like n=1 Tax=Mastomys coucha TaxID=35658 RepID=UPI001261A9B9|nr:tripartite motif-containing protein 30A-like [Mastomys coucha]
MKENERRCAEWWDDLQQQRTYWENKIQKDVKYIQVEYKGLRELLDSMENEKLWKLKKKKEDVVKRLEESENELVQQRQTVRVLSSYMQHQLELSTLERLQNKIQKDVEYIQVEYKGLRELLDSMVNEKLWKLKKEKEDVVKRLEESENELVQQRQSVRELISYMQHQLELSTMERLQSSN